MEKLLTKRGSRRGIAITVVVVVGVLVGVGAAAAANRFAVHRVEISPAWKGRAEHPLPVSVRFGLRVTEDDPTKRPAPTETYVMGTEGVVAFPGAFPSCSMAQLRPLRGPARACRDALVGGGLTKGAAGLAEDDAIKESVPCNLRLRVYNTGDGMALRLDGDPPLPPSFRSNKIGCPVPIHKAILGRLRTTTIDGVRSTDLSYTLPRLLLHPLEGWDGALRVTNVDLRRMTARARVNGRLHTVGYSSAVGCNGDERTVRAAFIDEQGERSEITRTTGC